MNEVLNCIATRRSVRCFAKKAIEREKLELIAEAGRMAPSGRNRQSWKFTVLTDGELINALAKAIAEETGAGETYCFYSPAALIIPTSDRENPLSVKDCSVALENIFLAAHSLGIGSVWINQLDGICDASGVRAVLDKLKIPSAHLCFGMAALGYAAEEALCPPKNENVIEFI